MPQFTACEAVLIYSQVDELSCFLDPSFNTFSVDCVGILFLQIYRVGNASLS